MPTIFSNKDVDSICRALVKQYNAVHEDTVAHDGYAHRDQTGVPTSRDFSNPSSSILAVSSANASDLATAVTLTNELRGKLKIHFNDDEAHPHKDDAGVSALDGYSDAEDLAAVQSQLNVMHHQFNAHLSRLNDLGQQVHVNNDTSTEVTDAEATDQSSSETLANSLKSSVNTHIEDGPEVGRIKLI